MFKLTKCEPLHNLFVDLARAFDTFSPDWLLKIMSKFGCPSRFIARVRQLHDCMQPNVHNDTEYCEPFTVTKGVKHCCVMAPTLSSMFSAMPIAFQECNGGFPIRYHFDGKLINLRRLQAKSIVHTNVLV